MAHAAIPNATDKSREALASPIRQQTQLGEKTADSSFDSTIIAQFPSRASLAPEVRVGNS
jgi:hypothetical protein